MIIVIFFASFIWQYHFSRSLRKVYKKAILALLSDSFLISALTGCRNRSEENGYYYCTSLFKRVWTYLLSKLKSCSQYVISMRWWSSSTMIPGGNRLHANSLLSHSTEQLIIIFIFIITMIIIIILTKNDCKVRGEFLQQGRL